MNRPKGPTQTAATDHPPRCHTTIGHQPTPSRTCVQPRSARAACAKLPRSLSSPTKVMAGSRCGRHLRGKSGASGRLFRSPTVGGRIVRASVAAWLAADQRCLADPETAVKTSPSGGGPMPYATGLQLPGMFAPETVTAKTGAATDHRRSSRLRAVPTEGGTDFRRLGRGPHRAAVSTSRASAGPL